MQSGGSAMSQAPESIVALAEARVAAKASKDFAQADQLRSQIASQGWQIKDVASGYELTPLPKRTFNVNEKLDLGIASDVTVGLVINGWIEDATHCLTELRRHCPQVAIVAVVIGEGDISNFARNHQIIDLYLEEDAGWGSTARWIVENSPSEFQVLMDPSTILQGDALSLMKAAISGDVVGVGWRGALIDREDQWRSVVDRGPGEVDVLLGYLMMVKRSSILETDTPHKKAKFYRNADLELSLALREQGGRLVAMDLPVRQERHHGYHDAEPEMRDRESKRNYDRILTRFRGRDEILSPRRSGDGSLG